MGSKIRFWEIDFIRGVAVILMIIFHLFFDLAFFYDIELFSLSYRVGFMWYVGRISALLFIVISGVSATLVWHKYGPVIPWKKFLKRGVIVFLTGVLITLMSFLLDSERTIWFGILHFLGISMLISPLFLRLRWGNVVLGVLLVSFGFYLEENVLISAPYLLPFGVKYYSFQSLDYYPLLPWFGVTLFGIFLGNEVYKKNQYVLPPFSFVGKKSVCYIGRYALLIYLVHQPVILFLLYLFLR